MIRVLVLLTYFLIFFNLSNKFFLRFILFFFPFYFFNILVPMSEEERKRQNLIAELYSTETAYVDNLKLVFEVRQNHSPLWSRESQLFTLLPPRQGVHQEHPERQPADQAGHLHPLHQLEGPDRGQHQAAEVAEDPSDDAAAAGDCRGHSVRKCRHLVKAHTSASTL